MPQAEVLPNDYTKTLTSTHSKRSVFLMRYGDIPKRLLQAHGDATKRLNAVHDRMNELSSAYREYIDLEDQAGRYEERMKRIVAALREMHEFEDVGKSARAGKNVSKTIGIAMDAYAVPLWEMMVVILEEFGELRVVEMEAAFDQLGVKTSRSAIESAIKTHKNHFRVRPGGASSRAKFISLKGA